MTEQQWREGIAAGKADERRQKSIRLDAALAKCGISPTEPKTEIPKPEPEKVITPVLGPLAGGRLRQTPAEPAALVLEEIEPEEPAPTDDSRALVFQGARKAMKLGFTLQEYLSTMGKPPVKKSVERRPSEAIEKPPIIFIRPGAQIRLEEYNEPVAHVREILMGIDGRLTILIERNEAESAFVIPIANW